MRTLALIVGVWFGFDALAVLFAAWLALMRKRARRLAIAATIEAAERYANRASAQRA
jgi:hypothetical protein